MASASSKVKTKQKHDRETSLSADDVHVHVANGETNDNSKVCALLFQKVTKCIHVAS